MTEAEWLAATDPTPMLDFLEDKTSDRKLRLFAIAYCLRINALLVDERSAKAVKVAEEFLEGKATDTQREEAHDAALKAYADSDAPEYWNSPLCLARSAASRAAYKDTIYLGITLLFAVRAGADFAAEASGEPTVEKDAQANLCRDIFGNPFRHVAVDPAWFTSDVLTLAESIYQDRDFSPMPILGDALQDAGCTSEEILSHCRQPGEHVRGCWVVDLILGKE